MARVMVEVDLDDIEDNDLIAEVSSRGLKVDVVCEQLKQLGCPGELRQMIEDWFALPVADSQKLTEWKSWVGNGNT